jgi:hypothetical protein
MSERPSDETAAESGAKAAVEHEMAPDPAAPGREAEEAAGGYSDPGLFGKLPRSRPGARSPRRRVGPDRPAPTGGDSGHGARAASATGRSKTAAGRAPRSDRAAEQPPPREPQPGAAEAEHPGGGIEELAWAGIAVTAEAATLGVRLLSRAINAARRAAERE